MVAKYSPAGNKAGSYKDNVLRGLFTSSICDSLNTIAFKAAMEDVPKTYSHWPFNPQVANQVMTAVSHETGTLEPFKLPVYHSNNLRPIVVHSKRCKNYKTESAVCRSNLSSILVSSHF